MPEEFSIELELGAALRNFFYNQLFTKPPYPTESFANQTIIVTGSNIGLGLEAARHFYRLGCAKLILAVRTVSKGQSAKEDIVQSVKHRTDADVIEVWPLDLTSTESTLAFADGVKELPRVDVLLENAGINSRTWSVSEGFEDTIQVNVINTFLLALSLLPKLRETKANFADALPHLVIVSSEGYRLTKFPEINAPDIYGRLNDGKDYVGQKRSVDNSKQTIATSLAFRENFRLTISLRDRYEISKLIELLFIRELVSSLNTTKSPAPPVVINLVSPGLSSSNLGRNRDPSLAFKILRFFLQLTIMHTAEEGSRGLVLSSCTGVDSNGEFMYNGVRQELEKWICTDMGKRAQRKVFEQTMKVLEMRKPGIGMAVGL